MVRLGACIWLILELIQVLTVQLPTHNEVRVYRYASRWWCVETIFLVVRGVKSEPTIEPQIHLTYDKSRYNFLERFSGKLQQLRNNRQYDYPHTRK